MLSELNMTSFVLPWLTLFTRPVLCPAGRRAFFPVGGGGIKWLHDIFAKSFRFSVEGGGGGGGVLGSCAIQWNLPKADIL